MNMYSVIGYRENYSQTSGIHGNIYIIEYYQSALNDNGNTLIFVLILIPVFHLNIKNNWQDRKWLVPLKYLSSLRKTLKIPSINCEINFILSWSTNCILISGSINNQVWTFKLTDTKLYVPVVTSSTQKNEIKISKIIMKW